jgi:phosphoribosylformylglycinamidine cyclo-ligase
MSDSDSSRYGARGVSASKSEVHKAVDKLDKGLFPNAFCKITEDPFSGDPERCCVIHADGSGTKSILAYLHYRETGDAKVFEGIAQDSIVMNLDDLLCVGVHQGIMLSSTINRNAHRCGGDVIAAIIQGNEKFIQTMRDFDIDVINGGGETADMGDVIRTISVDTCAVATMKRDQVIGEGIRPGLMIVGLSSSGQTIYETKENSGVGSNGLTSARHEMLSSHYRESYPEAFDPEIDPALVYCGPYRMQDDLPGSSLKVGEALLSPTRTYAPILVPLMKEKPGLMKALIHCSGGAQTKCLRFGQGVHFIKDDLFEAPPLFSEIQKHSGTDAAEMYKVYNMGHRMEVYVEPDDVQEVLDRAVALKMGAKVIGRTDLSEQPDHSSHLSLRLIGQEYRFTL